MIVGTACGGTCKHEQHDPLHSLGRLIAFPGRWFGASVDPPESGRWILVSCVVAPGFDFSDFVMHNGPEELTSRFPQHKDVIERMLPPVDVQEVEKLIEKAKEFEGKE